MPYICFTTTTIVPPGAAPPPPGAEGPELWEEESERAGAPRVRFSPDPTAQDWGFPQVVVEPKKDEEKYIGWKMATAWAGAIVVSWALLIGGVMTVRALLP